MIGIKMKLFMIIWFSLITLLQLGLGHALPFDQFEERNATALKATEAPPSGQATNGTTTKANTSTILTTLKPSTQTTLKNEKLTTKAATPAKETTAASRKNKGKVYMEGMLELDMGKKEYVDGLLDLDYPIRPHKTHGIHHKRRSHVGARTKAAPVAPPTTAAPMPLAYYNLISPMVEQELNYEWPLDLLPPPPEMSEELVGNGAAPMKHRRKHKASPPPQSPLPPLLSILKPSHHEKSPIMEFLDDVMEMVTTNSSVIEAKPYGYFNQMVSPDGKLERNEFGVVTPNMMIEAVQQEDKFGVPTEILSLEHTYKFSPKKLWDSQHRHEKPPQQGLPEYGIDMALRTNYELINRLLRDLEKEDDLLQAIRDATVQLKQTKDVWPMKRHEPKEELLVSCPIHHEHHMDRHGEMVEEDVVEVRECEAVKIQD